MKPGMYVVTMGGVSGKIVGIKQTKDMTYILLQTGDTTHKSYLTVDIEAIYQICEDPGEILHDDINVEGNTDIKRED